MLISSAKVTSKGQITLPADVRKDLGIKPGDRIDFRRGTDGGIALVARTHRLEDLKGMLPYDGPDLSNEDIVAIVRAAREDMAAQVAARLDVPEE